ncbi:hypothetical protein B0E37_06206 [Streptomyces sp. MH192]|nr:hypothetical protein [Streptomyces sp. MH192]MCF0103608.1 hypothetical protein [Streptomyces sp. MH191]
MREGAAGAGDLLGQRAEHGGDDPRQVPQRVAEFAEDQRHHGEHPRGHDRAGGPLQLGHLGAGRPPAPSGHEPEQDRFDLAVQIGHPGQVAEDVVPVEPHGRHELFEDLEVPEVDGGEEEGLPGGEVRGRHGEHEHHVEVDAAEVGAEPAGAADPVDVGDVRVHRGPDQEQPAADAAGPGAAVAAGGGVSELVEDERGHGEDEDDQQQHRLVEDLQDGGDRAEEREQPHVEGGHAGQHGDHHRRTVQPGERAGDARDPALVEDDPVPLEREQQVRTGCDDLVLLLSLGNRHPERVQLLLDQIADVVRAELPPEPGADPVGDGLRVADAVDRGGHEVQQPGELHDLPVPPTGDVLGCGEPRALVLAVQREPRAEPRHSRALHGDDRQGARGRLLVGHGYPPGPGHRSGVPGRRRVVPQQRHVRLPPPGGGPDLPPGPARRCHPRNARVTGRC